MPKWHCRKSIMTQRQNREVDPHLNRKLGCRGPSAPSSFEFEPLHFRDEDKSEYCLMTREGDLY